jgi:endonuclease III
MDGHQATSILQVLRENLALPNWTVMHHDPFETLIATIISQNTSDTNTEKAFECLSNQFEVTPKALAEAETCKLEACLHVAGLSKSKSKTIKAVSKIIEEKFGGSLGLILSLPLNEARKTLMGLSGIGPKTADVVLLFCVNQPTVPVDTHVNRVSKRLHLAPENGNYEDVRLSLQTLFPPKDYLALHLLLIAHGRKYCKAIKPLCVQCPVNSNCPSKSVGVKND